MTVLERLRRWWKPGEYDEEESRQSEGEGHPLSTAEREEEKEPELRIGRR